MALWEKDDVSVSELGDRLNLPVSGVAPVLDRLERAGLLDRRRGTRDRRILMVVLTDAGRALEELAARFHHRVHCQTELSGSQLVGLRTQLHALTRAMEDVLDTNTTIS